MTTICIYHAECADGYAAAWALSKAIPGATLIPGVYNQSPPDVAGAKVYLVDFSYPAATVLKMLETAISMVILDHHKAAAENLKDTEHPHLTKVIDMDHSGAMLTWKYFFTDEPPPLLLRHLEDRDLWRKEMPGTDELMAAVMSYPFELAVWDDLMVPSRLKTLQAEGVSLLRARKQLVASYLKQEPTIIHLGGYDVPLLNVPRELRADVTSVLAEGWPFAASYYDTKHRRTFSLRSTPDGVDVNEVAKQFGGGGHKHAAGFSLRSVDYSLLSVPS